MSATLANLFRILEERAAEAPGHPALVRRRDGREEVMTYGELERHASEIAASLSAAGLGRGDRALVLAPISVDLYVVLLALLKLSATAVVVESALGIAQLLRSCERVRPAALIGVRRAHLLRLASRALRDVRLAIVVGDGRIPGAMTLAALHARAAAPVSTALVGNDTPALLTFTSGTTGEPKMLRRGHDLLWAQHRALADAFPIGPRDRVVSAAPLFVLHDLAAGATAVIPASRMRAGAPLDPTALVAQILGARVTILRGNPRCGEAIAADCERHGLALHGVRAVFLGGAPVPTALVARLRRLLPDGEVYVAYGSSEAEPIAGIAGAELLAETAAGDGRGFCVGTPIGPTELRIEPAKDAGTADGLGTVVEGSQVGEICVAGPHVNADGWLRTGDTGYRDGSGRLWLLGRAADRVRRDGREMHSYAVEPLIERLPFVDRCALVGVPDAALGQRSVLVVSARRQGPLALLARARWRRAIERVCADQGIPIDEIRWTSTMPLDPRHRSKIRREELRRRLAGSPA